MFFVSCTEFCLLSIGSWYVLLYPARSMSFSHKSHVWLFATPWTVAHQAPLSMGFFQVIILEWVATLQSSQISSVQFSSVTQSCPTLYDPKDCSTPGLPAHHQFPEFTQTHVHRIGDAIQPSYSLSYPSPPTFNISFPASGSFPVSQLFSWGGQSIGISASASVLPMNIQDWFPLGWPGWISLQSKGLSRVSSNTAVQKHRLFGAQLSL